MASKVFRAIMAGLEDMRAHLEGDATRGRTTVVNVTALDVADVRGKTGLSQDRFASTFAIKVATLRNWEQGRTKPDGPARVLLTVIDRDPVAVLRALRVGARAAPRARTKEKKRAVG